MYDEILNSKKLSQAAALFLSLPQRSYSISEAAGFLRVSPGMGAHILNRLTANGILRVFIKRGKKYFFYDSRHELPAWARNKILKAKKKAEDRLFKDAKKLSVKAAFLSGVFTGYANLPVDILLVGRVDLKKLDRFLQKWQKIVGLELNYSLIPEKEFSQRRGTFDRFLKDIFDHRYITVVDRLGRK